MFDLVRNEGRCVSRFESSVNKRWITSGESWRLLSGVIVFALAYTLCIALNKADSITRSCERRVLSPMTKAEITKTISTKITTKNGDSDMALSF